MLFRDTPQFPWTKWFASSLSRTKRTKHTQTQTHKHTPTHTHTHLLTRTDGGVVADDGRFHRYRVHVLQEVERLLPFTRLPGGARP